MSIIKLYKGTSEKKTRIRIKFLKYKTEKSIVLLVKGHNDLLEVFVLKFTMYIIRHDTYIVLNTLVMGHQL